MRLRTFLTYLSLLPLGACTRCDDYDNSAEFDQAQLPPYTEIGANTMGCRIVPQVWTILGQSEQWNNTPPLRQQNKLVAVPYNYASGPLLKVTGRMTGVREGLAFYDMELQLTFRLSDTLGGLRLLGSDTARFIPSGTVESMHAVNYAKGSGDYHSLDRRPVRLTIRHLDEFQRIVSGTFEGWLYGGSSSPDSLEVADGRFDIKY